MIRGGAEVYDRRRRIARALVGVERSEDCAVSMPLSQEPMVGLRLTLVRDGLLESLLDRHKLLFGIGPSNFVGGICHDPRLRRSVLLLIDNAHSYFRFAPSHERGWI